jgi:hypothetical protein
MQSIKSRMLLWAVLCKGFKLQKFWITKINRICPMEFVSLVLAMGWGFRDSNVWIVFRLARHVMDRMLIIAQAVVVLCIWMIQLAFRVVLKAILPTVKPKHVMVTSC